jgi:hypothetical protein
MSTDRDNEIQDKLDRDELMAVDRDVQAYRRVYESLADQPVELPSNFVGSVMARIVEVRISARESLTMLIALGATLLAVASGVGSIWLLRGFGYLEAVSIEAPVSLPQGVVYVAVALALIATLDAVISQARGRAR